jgi:hypothetical protein
MKRNLSILNKARSSQRSILLSPLAVLVLSGCFIGGTAFSPEAAAQRAVLENPNPDMHVDPNTVQVLQRFNLDDKTLVMLSFSGNDIRLGATSCLYMYEVLQMPWGGWSTGSGGGGCTSGDGNQQEQPLSIGASISSGSKPHDFGLSAVYGQVFVPEIRVVEVTWKDSMMQQVEVINASYLAARAGQVEMERVDGLNADNEIVYSSEPRIDPGKQKIEEENNNAKP